MRGSVPGCARMCGAVRRRARMGEDARRYAKVRGEVRGWTTTAPRSTIPVRRDIAAGQGLGGLGGRDVRREQGADWGVLRCSAGGTSNGEVRGIEAESPVFLSTIYLKGKHQACPPCPFARISLPTPQSPTTHQKRKKWISDDHFGGAWFGCSRTPLGLILPH